MLFILHVNAPSPINSFLPETFLPEVGSLRLYQSKTLDGVAGAQTPLGGDNI